MATAKADSSAVASSTPADVDATSPKAKGHRRASSSVTDVYKPADLSMFILYILQSTSQLVFEDSITILSLLGKYPRPHS